MEQTTTEVQAGVKFVIPILIEIIGIKSYIMFFIIITYYIKIRFDIINKILIMMLDKKSVNELNQKVPLKSFPSIHFLNILATLHIQLKSIIKIMNKIFSLPIMFFMAYNLSGLTFSLYETYDLISSGKGNIRQIGYNIGVYVENLTYFIYCLATIVVSSLIGRSSNKTLDILMEFSHKNHNEKFQKRIRIFILQIKSSRTSFSCGLFNFDWILLYSVSKRILIVQ